MIVIKNGYVINPKTGFEGKADVLIKDDKIVSIGEAEVCEDAEVIDATGLVVAPGLVDVHTHFRDPGFEYKEDIYTGAKAAAAGGYTTVIMMCNTKPTIDNVDTLSYVLNKGKETGIHVESCGAVSFGLKGEKLTDMDDLNQIPVH